MNVLELNKMSASAINWVLKAVYKSEDRPVIRSVKVTDDYIEAANGFVVHAANIKLDVTEGLYPFNKPNGAILVVPETFEGNFPDIAQCLPRKIEGDVAVELCINPTLLAETLIGMDGYARIKIIVKKDGTVTQPIEIFGKGKETKIVGEYLDPIDYYALIMPALASSTDANWNPYRKEEK